MLFLLFNILLCLFGFILFSSWWTWSKHFFFIWKKKKPHKTNCSWFHWSSLFFFGLCFIYFLYHLVCYSFLLVCSFILLIKFFIYNFFIFSSSLLKFSLCSSIFPPNSVSIHLLTFWILYLVNYLYFTIFSVLFSCTFNRKQFLCLLILLNYSISMNLPPTITNHGLEIVSLCGSVHYRLLTGWHHFPCLLDTIKFLLQWIV